MLNSHIKKRAESKQLMAIIENVPDFSIQNVSLIVLIF